MILQQSTIFIPSSKSIVMLGDGAKVVVSSPIFFPRDNMKAGEEGADIAGSGKYLDVEGVELIFPVMEKKGKKHVIIQNNPRRKKAVIYPYKGRIHVNEKWLKSLPVMARRFVINHELAHTSYNEEWKCDVVGALMSFTQTGIDSRLYLSFGAKTLSNTAFNRKRIKQAKACLQKTIKAAISSCSPLQPSQSL